MISKQFFEEKLSADLELPSSDIAIIKDDHYPPISEGIAAAEIQDIPAPRQIFSSGEFIFSPTSSLLT